MNKNDPYTSTAAIVERLHREYKKHPKLIIAVDFDCTVFDYKMQGTEYPRAINVVKQCAALGFYVVLWTASAPERFEFMKEYMQKNQVHISSINENPIKLPFGNHKKIYYNILLDDRAGLGQALDALEIFIDNIQNDREPATHAPTVNPIATQINLQDLAIAANCNQLLEAAGLAHARTCIACGLGPCKHPKN